MPANVLLKTGDAFSTQRSILCHGVNCRGVMASGFARSVAEKYPSVRQAYLQKHRDEGWRLGEVQVVCVEGLRPGPGPLYVANLATQQTYGREPGRRYVNYDAISTSLDVLFSLASAAALDVAMPRIGAGLGGGDWGVILGLVRDAAALHDIEVEIWTPA